MAAEPLTPTANSFPFPMQIVLTADGSPTLYLPERGEHYHSLHGALGEARHVYIEAGLNHCRLPLIRVLEMGFGTGLNALLTGGEAERRGIQVLYTGLENRPLPPEIIERLPYPDLLFLEMHRAEWGVPIRLSPYFTFQKIQVDFCDYAFPEPCDVVYFDAFSPEKQPEAWSQELFDALFAALSPGGVLTTYCAKGAVRRAMQGSGFAVERLAGPPAGKREILRAIKPAIGTGADGSGSLPRGFSLPD